MRARFQNSELPSNALVFGVICAALSLTACGGADRGRESSATPVVQPVDQCALASTYTLQNIVDFEPVVTTSGATNRHAVCDPALAMFCNAPTPSPFYLNYDSAHTIPSPGALPADVTNPPVCLSFDPIDIAGGITGMGSDVSGTPLPGNGRCSISETALHVVLSNVGQCYGTTGRLGWGASLDLTMRVALDTTTLPGGPYDGISFWVKTGTGSTRPSIILSVIDPTTDSAPDNTNPQHCGCWYNPTDPSVLECPKDPSIYPNFPDSLKCDPFGMGVTLTPDWSFVAARFADMKQKGFGKVSTNAHVDATQITRMQFLMTAGDWDYWIDDISLFKAPPTASQ